MQQKQIHYKIAGHEFNLDEQVATAADFLLWGKDLVDEAIKASTEASLAWAGVCLILPLLTHLFQARQANEEGFVYVTSRLGFYAAFEFLLFPTSGHSSQMSQYLVAFLKKTGCDTVRSNSGLSN